ncbi:PKS-NRPS hybrid synthetase cheA-like [Lactuca sativa]|uniref:PKS-NRPS hybrid synthetase cheA-like n=1 Tax=Lactuca sativa TaxID=4236 RepID=UPI000CD7F083|nr:PKS-NRPS hybrid synthetase cheA-like [Lactuca sativa]
MDSSSSTIQNQELYLANSKFESYDELLKSLRDFYYAKGYGVSIKDSSKDKYVTLQCDRGGSYRDRMCIGDKRKKNSGSRLINCSFQIVGKKGNDGFWVLKAKNLTHNYEPSTDISGHPSFRRLSPNDVQSVKNMTLSGIPPRQILSSLRQQNPNIPAVSRTIYNLKAKIRKQNLGNRSMVSALFEEFEKEGFIYDILHNSVGHITHLFIAHPLEREDEDSYIWALSVFKKTLENHEPSVIMSDRELALMNAINMVFPNTTNLLCIWHIEKNVLAYCKKHFAHGEEFDLFMFNWNNVAYSTTITIFEQNWAKFELFYQTKKVAIEYIKNTWLPWKEKFVSAWTKKYLHFGNRSSSRAEGAHAKLKKYLQVSTGGFQDVTEKICLAIKHEFNEIKVQLASEKIQVLRKCDAPAFREILCRVSHFALKEIYTQYEKIKNGTMTPCTGHFMATMGLPCVHKLKHLQGMTNPLDLIHPHWKIDTLRLNLEDDSHNDDTKEFDELINELSSRYKM